MRNLATQLWQQTDGAIISAEFLLIGTILVIGLVAGLSSVRDSVVTELADVAQAFANINQSYSYSGAEGHHVYTAGSAFYDLLDFCDSRHMNGHGQRSKCVEICSVGAQGEGGGHGGHGGW